jgi:uncharacterized protein YecT (DUF1311 family)
MTRFLPLMLILAAPAGAQALDCNNAMTQVEMTGCAEQEWKSADTDLNATYKLAIAFQRQIDSSLPADQAGAEAALRDSQRAWVAFRDSACTAEGYAYHGGTAEPMVIYSCRARLTQARTEDLRAMAEQN